MDLIVCGDMSCKLERISRPFTARARNRAIRLRPTVLVFKEAFDTLQHHARETYTEATRVDRLTCNIHAKECPAEFQMTLNGIKDLLDANKNFDEAVTKLANEITELGMTKPPAFHCRNRNWRQVLAVGSE